MDVIYFLIPLALILLAAAIGAFLWAVKSNQFDNLDREAYRILFDEDMVNPKANADTKANNSKTNPIESSKTNSQESAEQALNKKPTPPAQPGTGNTSSNADATDQQG